MAARLDLTRAQVVAYRRRAGGLDERATLAPASLRQAAWAGLQDSMPRAALLSLHARLEGVQSTTWEHPSLGQLWGPRFNAYVVAWEDFALFSLGRLPDDARGRERAERMAALMRDRLGDARMTDRELGRAIGLGNSMRYGTATGTIAIRWEGARAPLVWAVPAPGIAAADARRELARRHLRVFGPTTAERFARWAGIARKQAAITYAELEPELLPVRTPLGEEWLLAADADELDAATVPPAAARLLPSGDAYFLLHGRERELLVPDPDRRARLWTSRVWPGALLVQGEIRGTWRRANHVVRIETWERLSPAALAAVEAEAASLPLPGLGRAIEVSWE